MSETDDLLRVVEDVTFAQLRTFACAARAGSFAKAAEMLDISQPAVSEQIQILEERLGRRLFDRRKGTTPLLTLEGEEALAVVHTILVAGGKLFGQSRKSAGKVVLRISAGPYLQEKYLRPLLPRIYQTFPDVEITLLPTGAPADLARRFERGELDLAIYAILAGAEAPPDARYVCELPMTMVAPAGTQARLAAGTCSLDDFQYIFPGSREFNARWARRVLRDLGLAPRVPPLFIQFVDALAQMVEDGHGIGHLMTYSVAPMIAAGRLEALDLPLPPMRRYIGRSPHAPDIAEAVEKLLCDALTV